MIRLAWIAGILGLLPCAASAEDVPSVWYDSAKQALAIDPYAGGWGHRIDIDFDADHSDTGLISGLWHYQYGYVTLPGVVHVIEGEGWSVQQFGWAEFLGDLAPVYSYSNLVDWILDDTPAPSPYYYFTPEWNVAAGKTVIYAQPAPSEIPTPVTDAMLANTFVRFDEGVWYPFAEVPLALTPLAVDLQISPSTVNPKASSAAVTARITLPAPYTTDDLQLETVTVTIDPVVTAFGFPLTNFVSLKSKVSGAAHHGSTLTAKFDREAILNMLPSGSATVYVTGILADGRPLHGSTVLTVRK